MSARLIEETVNLIEAQIRANIATALASVRSDVGNLVSTEVPQSYFQYPKAIGYQLPAIFIIGESFDFQKSERRQNFVDGIVKVNLSILIDDRDAQRLTIKAYRYMRAIYDVLDLQVLTSIDNRVKLVVKVIKAENSALYAATNESDPNNVFRKEVYFTLDVEHYENF